ncbi:MAG TPA: large conductance mechanosensitive channel protein MscL [Actinomycetales bacterium]|nr:large conductance mechanosensitive channel protein MscL [Actinomycetales bacterium]
MIKGFKEFIMRGNVIDLAVAVVIGTALTAVVDRIVTGIINPLIAMLGGQPSLGSITITINNAVFQIGAVLDALITFVVIAAAVYFVIVVPMNKLIERRQAGLEPEPEPVTAEAELLTEIRDLLKERQ